MQSENYRGVALIMALLILIVLAVLVGQLSYSTKIDYYTAQNNSDDLQNRYALISAINQAIAYLQLDSMKKSENQEKYDTLNDGWAKPRELTVGNTQVTYTITDENSKFNLLLLKESKKSEDDKQNPPDPQKPKDETLTPEEQFDRLIEVIYEKQQIIQAKPLREAIVAWLKDKVGKEELEGPFLNKIPIFSVKELLLAKEVNHAILYGESSIEGKSLPGLLEYVTVWSDSKININTASKRVLQSLAKKIDVELADKIVRYRERDGDNGEKQVFKKEDELKKVEGISSDKPEDDVYSKVKNLITVRSHYFNIQATATSGRMTKKMTVVVYRSGKRVYKLFSDEE
jgi:general secretion pathway protein K